MDVPEDLGLLVLGRVLEQVRDLGRLQPPDPGQRAAQARAAGVPDQRLEPGPVAERAPGLVVAVPAGQPPEPAGPAVGVHPGEHPLLTPVGGPLLAQLQVVRPDQVGALHVDEPVAQHVPAQQDLAVPALEPAQVELGAGELELLAVEDARLLDGDEYLPAAHFGHQPLHHRQGVAGQPHDDVLHLAEGLPLAVGDRAVEQL